jgi:predicted ATPase
MGYAQANSFPVTAPALLEREDELTALAALVSATEAGDGGTLAIEGPPGIGKTSVLMSARGLASAAGFALLDARGAELERTFSFGVVLQLLDTAVRADGSPELWSGAARLARGLFEADAMATRAESESELPTLYGLYWLVARLAERRPLLITVDDLQWADRASLRTLGFLARRVDGLPIAVVARSAPRSCAPKR